MQYATHDIADNMVGWQQVAGERYCLTRDNDCHWYVIPAARQQEWSEWLDSPEYEDGEPEWAKPVGGSPSLVTFVDPEIG